MFIIIINRIINVSDKAMHITSSTYAPFTCRRERKGIFHAKQVSNLLRRVGRFSHLITHWCLALRHNRGHKWWCPMHCLFSTYTEMLLFMPIYSKLIIAPCIMYLCLFFKLYEIYEMIN